MSNNNVLLVSDQEHATILNALRFWQAAGHPIYPDYFPDEIGSPVAAEDVDDFIDRINGDCSLTVMCTIEGGIVTQAFVPGATDRIAIHVFDLDTDGVAEEDLCELHVPLSGVRSGVLYSAQANIEAAAFLRLLNDKIEQDVMNAQIRHEEIVAGTELLLSQQSLDFGVAMMEADGIASFERHAACAATA